jgi:hypothetical protein
MSFVLTLRGIYPSNLKCVNRIKTLVGLIEERRVDQSTDVGAYVQFFSRTSSSPVGGRMKERGHNKGHEMERLKKNEWVNACTLRDWRSRKLLINARRRGLCYGEPPYYSAKLVRDEHQPWGDL